MRTARAKSMRSYLKKKIAKSKRAGGMTQEIEHLPRLCKVQNSHPSTAKNNNKVKRTLY
jgi:hypothetical protein